MSSKKYNNKSTFVQDWTTTKLKRNLLGLLSEIQYGDSPKHTLEDYQACRSELETRGYNIEDDNFTRSPDAVIISKE